MSHPPHKIIPDPPEMCRGNLQRGYHGTLVLHKHKTNHIYVYSFDLGEIFWFLSPVEKKKFVATPVTDGQDSRYCTATVEGSIKSFHKN